MYLPTRYLFDFIESANSSLFSRPEFWVRYSKRTYKESIEQYIEKHRGKKLTSDLNVAFGAIKI